MLQVHTVLRYGNTGSFINGRVRVLYCIFPSRQLCAMVEFRCLPVVDDYDYFKSMQQDYTAFYKHLV